ncbi:hypothetical protein [Actinokineospora sp. HUAS TT18]|uniref:hypothetical protein n=1 Tax=Actinokineospora sp. HUAS TT18 TaxID=3447451 RepID=UPI003F51E050
MGATPQKEANAASERNLPTPPVWARILAATTSPMPCRRPVGRHRGLVGPELRTVAVDEQIAALRALTEHRDDMVRTRTQTVNGLHALLVKLVPSGLPRGLTADTAAAALRRTRPCSDLGRTLRALGVELVAEVRRLDHRVASTTKALAEAVTRSGSTLTTVGFVALAAVSGGQQPDAPRELRGHVHHRDAVRAQPFGQRRPRPAAPSIAQLACGQAGANRRSRGDTCHVDRHPHRTQRRQPATHGHRRPGCLVRIDSDHNPVSRIQGPYPGCWTRGYAACVSVAGFGSRLFS